MDDRQFIADLLSALEYHTEQTRPIEFSKVAIEAAREYLRKPEQPAQQEPVTPCTHPSLGFSSLREDGAAFRWSCVMCGTEFVPKTTQRWTEFNEATKRNIEHAEWYLSTHPKPAQQNIRNATLDEIADKIAAMPFGDTAASFAVWIQEQKT